MKTESTSNNNQDMSRKTSTNLKEVERLVKLMLAGHKPG